MQQQKTNKAKLTTIFIVILAVSLLVFLAACAPQESTEPVSEAEAPVNAVEEEEPSTSSIDLKFTMNSDCVTCHTNAQEATQNSLTVSNVHASHDVGCITCHSQEKELTEVHANATSMDEPKRLKTAKLSEESCLQCHVSYEDLAAKTTDITVLTDANGMTVNPHAAKQLNAEHESKIDCMKCHSEHDEVDANQSQNYCMNCHHMKVYECNTCHDNH